MRVNKLLFLFAAIFVMLSLTSILASAWSNITYFGRNQTYHQDDWFYVNDPAIAGGNNNSIYILINVSNITSDVADNIYDNLSYVAVNCTSIVGNTSGRTTNASFIAKSGNYSLFMVNCTANSTFLNLSLTRTPVVNKTLKVFVVNTTGSLNTSTYTVTLYNITVPPGLLNGSTNFSEISNMSKINLTFIFGRPGPSDSPGVQPEGGRFKFIDANIINIGPRLSQLRTNMNITIANSSASGGYNGNSFVFLNSSYFTELNTTTILTIYSLPFKSLPTIKYGNGSACGDGMCSGISYTYDAASGVGTFTFTVTGFSQYNTTDETKPIVEIDAASTIKTNLSGTSDTTPTFNLTLNGTGADLVNGSIKILVDSIVYNLTNVSRGVLSGGNDEKIYVNFTTYALSNGTHTLNVSVSDFGGTTGNDINMTYFFSVYTDLPKVTSVTLSDANVTGNGTVNITVVFNRIMNLSSINVTLYH